MDEKIKWIIKWKNSFGQKIQWVGGEPGEGIAYNYVDSSYMQSLLNFGPIILALILAGLILMGIFIAIRKDTYFLLVFVLFAVHSTFDPQLTWIGYNCFLMAYSYIHCDANHIKKQENLI